MNGLKREFGDTVTVRYVDVDDPANSDLVEQYGANAIPTTVILDQDGRTASTWRGLTTKPRLKRAIEKVLFASVEPA